MATAPISLTCPDNGAAIAYARQHFANSDEPGVIICGCVDSAEAPGEAKDVLFILPGERKARRFVIWHDGDAIYGEW